MTEIFACITLFYIIVLCIIIKRCEIRENGFWLSFWVCVFYFIVSIIVVTNYQQGSLL